MSPRFNRKSSVVVAPYFFIGLKYKNSVSLKNFQEGGVEEKCETPTNGKEIAILATVNRHLLLKYRQKVTAGLVVRPLQVGSMSVQRRLLEKAIYRRTLGTQIQKCGFPERAESLSKRLQSRSESSDALFVDWAAAQGLGHLECLKTPATYL